MRVRVKAAVQHWPSELAHCTHLALHLHSQSFLAEPSGKAERIINHLKLLQIMAKIFYLLKQNKNTESKIYGKWFAQAKSV